MFGLAWSSDCLQKKQMLCCCTYHQLTERLQQIGMSILTPTDLHCMTLPSVAAWWSLLCSCGRICARYLMHDLGSTSGI